MSRRRVLVITLALLALLLLTPLLAGYFGPTAATYVTTWRPWRSGLHVRLEQQGPSYVRSDRARAVASYSDPWPGSGRSPGHQVVFVTLSRPNVLLPWVVTERGAGP